MEEKLEEAREYKDEEGIDWPMLVDDYAGTELTPDERTVSAYATTASSSIACSYSDGLR